MRDRDRFWWVPIIIGLVFCAIGVLVPYLFWRVFLWGDPYMTGADYTQDLGLLAVITLLCLGAGAGFVISCVPGRRRHLRRAAALRGDAAAMPVAAIHPDPASAPDVAGQPLELIWRVGKGTKYLRGPLTIVQLVIALVSVAASIFALVGPILLPALFAPSDPFSPPPPPMSLIEIILRIAGACAILALVVGGGVVFARVTPFLFGRPFGITATTTGLEKYTEFGNRVSMAWGEMRLLEVTKGTTSSRRGFVVYAPGKSITWAEYTEGFPSEYTPVGVTASEMTLRQAALLDLIAARTALTPYTFAKALEREPEPIRKTHRSSGAAALLVIALIIAGCAAAETWFPVTPYAWANWASVGSLATATLLLGIASLWTALTRRELPAHATPPSVGAPSFDAPGVTYSFRWRTPGLRRFWIILIGLCLAVNLAPSLYAMIEFILQWIRLFLPGFQSPPALSDLGLSTGEFFLAIIVGMVGIMGLALVYAGIIVATAHIQANRDGLYTSRGRSERLIPWSSVIAISWGSGAGGQAVYLVKIDAPTTQISWPAGIQHVSPLPPGDGALPIGPDELAALVAARIGKPIGVRP